MVVCLLAGCDRLTDEVDVYDGPDMADALDAFARDQSLLDPDLSPDPDVSPDVEVPDDPDISYVETIDDTDEGDIQIPPPLILEFDATTVPHPLLDTGKFILYRQPDLSGPGCDSISTLELPSGGFSSPDFRIENSFTFKSLPGLQKDLVQGWIVVGMAWSSQDMDKRLRAWGCKEVTVHWMETLTVSIELITIPPALRGTYEIESRFDLISGLPPSAAAVVDTVTGFFQNPPARVFQAFCDGNLNTASLRTFCDLLFVDPENPSMTNLTHIGEVAFDIFSGNTTNLLTTNCPDTNTPEVCADLAGIGDEFDLILRNITLLSTVRCSSEPDRVTGTGTCTETWHTLLTRWTLGRNCVPSGTACGWLRLPFDLVPGIGADVTAQFEVILDDSDRLAVGNHTVDFDFLGLVNFAIEKLLLPAIFGSGSDGLPAVDSWENLFGVMLGGKSCLFVNDCCETFATNLVDRVGQTGGLTTNLATSACSALIELGPAYLRNLLTSPGDNPRGFTIGTPPDQPCQLHDFKWRGRVDSWGEPFEQCTWDLGLTLGGTTINPQGQFLGIRQ
jgi:hypothetical protein